MQRATWTSEEDHPLSGEVGHCLLGAHRGLLQHEICQLPPEQCSHAEGEV